MGPVELVFLLIPLGILIVLLMGLRKTTRLEAADTWAAAHGVALTPETRAIVDRYLIRSRQFKLTGAVLGIVLPLGTKIPGLEMIGGFLVGALLAELQHPRPVLGAETSASLIPRSIEDYLPGYVIAVLRTAALATLPLVLLYIWGPQRSSQPDLDTAVTIACIASVVAPLGIEALLRRIVGRPQPAAHAHPIAVDDAMRSSSLHAVAGAGIAVSLLLVGVLAQANAMTSDIDLVRWVLLTSAVMLAFAAFSFWILLSSGMSWKVGRSDRLLGTSP